MKPTSLALACLAVLSGAAQASVQSDVNYQYYEAHAAPGMPLYRALLAATPIHENGRSFFGHTSDELHWWLHWSDTGKGRCRIDDVRVTMHATILLPHLAGLESMDAERAAEYTRFFKALGTHEEGHYRLDRQMAAAIEQELAALPDAPCDGMEGLANAKGHEIEDTFKHKNEQYDEATDHGRTQGAYLKN